MPDKMNLDVDYLKLQYREFQKYEVMNMSVVGGLPKKKKKQKKKNTQIPVIKHQNTTHALF